MQFYDPAMLWWMAALVLPVLIHLFDLRPLRRVYFSHLPMLREVLRVVDRRMRRKVMKIWVLVCRLLAWACLVMAFAQPYVPVSSKYSKSDRVLLYVDNSYSMSRSTSFSEVSALDASIYVAQQVVGSYEEGTEFFLLTNDYMPLRSYSSDEVLDRLSLVEYSSLRRTFQQFALRAGPLLRESLPMDVYWMSDFQANLFEEGVPFLSDSLHQWYVLPVSVRWAHNLFIDTAYSESPAWVSGVPNQLCLRVVNLREEPCDPCTLRFSVEGVEQALQTVEILPYGRQEVCFEYSAEPLGSQRARVEVEDPLVRFDNTFYVSLTEAQPVNIVEIAPPLAPSYIGKAYAESQRFSYQRFEPRDVPYELLYAQDLVILHGLPQLSEALRLALFDFLGGGGDLLVIPPLEADLTSYGELLVGFSRVDEEGELLPLAAPLYQMPFFGQVFSRKESQVSMPRARQLYSWQPLDVQSILGFVDESAFLSRSSIGEGECYLLSVPLLGEYTDFAKHSIFVPVLYRIATRSQRRFDHLYYSPRGQELSLTLRGTDSLKPLFSLGGESGEKYLLSARREMREYALSLARRSYLPGFYRLEQDTSFLTWVAFNVTPLESDLRVLDREELEEKCSTLRNIHFIDEDLATSAQGFLSQVDRPRELWGYFLVAALLFLFVEMACLRYFWKSGTSH